MKKYRSIIIVLLSFSFFLAAFCKKAPEGEKDQVDANKARFKVLLMVSTLSKMNPLGPFFTYNLINYTKTAASALNIHLKEVVYDFDNPETTDAIEKQINASQPDGILILPFALKQYTWSRMNNFLLKHVLNNKIPLISFHNTMIGLGKPGITPYYIGQVIPDESTSGYLLATELIRQARKTNKRKLKIVGLAASLYDPASTVRIEGLRRAVREDGNSVIQQIFPVMHYSPTTAKGKTALILSDRYPDTDIVWCSSDSIAKGVIDALKINDNSDSKLIIGGIDWSPWAIEALQKGEIHATVGGHCYDGARAVILLYDYLNGKEFSSEGSTFRTKMSVLTQDDKDATSVHDTENLRRIIPFMTRTHNPEMKSYSFDSRSFISQTGQNKGADLNNYRNRE